MKTVVLTFSLLALFIAGSADAAPSYSGRRLPAPLRLGDVPFSNMGIVQVDQPETYSRIVALSDVHGMYHNLCQLLYSVHLVDQNLHWTGGQTLLIVVGDSIDKGSDSIDILDLWMNLIPQARTAGGAIIHTLGDHEAEFLANPINAKDGDLINELHIRSLPVNQLTDPNYPRAAFLRSMPLAVRVGNWLFAHAGFFPQMNWPSFFSQAQYFLEAGAYESPFITGPSSILEALNWWKDPGLFTTVANNLNANHLYGMVFGHQPEAFGVIGDIAGVDSLHFIKIDSGMAPDAGAHPGHLLVFTQPAQLETMAPPQAYSLDGSGNLRAL